MESSTALPASLILASASPRRQELLRQMGCVFRVETSAAEELHTEALTAREIALVNAYRKARDIAARFPDAVVIGADTLVYLGTRLFGKPATRDEAVEMLEELQGHTHEVVTGVCLLQITGHRHRSFAEVTEVTFRRLDRKAIEDYLDKINPLDKAGAYAIQEFGHLIVENICGSYSNVVGFPVERMKSELAEWRI